MSAAVALAFGAGMVATINPCGFAMLPAYLSYFMGIQEEGRSRAAVLRSALLVGGVVSLGFLVVFGIAGTLISAASTSLAANWIPWLALAVGFGLVILGIALLRGYELKIGLPKTGRASTERSMRNVFGFGVSYAVASLSCTLPAFLALIATQFASRSFISGILLFGVYVAGMATVLMALTVVLALGKRGLLNRLRGAGQYINRISGGLLVAAGLWISWFWITTLRSGAASLNDSAAFRFIERLSQTLVNFVAQNTLYVGLGLGAVVLLATYAATRSDDPDPGDPDPEDPGQKPDPEPVLAGRR